jgi:hypothetical protein
MKKMQVICFCFGTVFLSIALYNTILWVVVADDSKSMDILRDEYLACYPRYFRNLNLSNLKKVNLITGVDIILTVLSGLLYRSVWVTNNSGILAQIAKVLLFICIILGGWLTFSLM